MSSTHPAPPSTPPPLPQGWIQKWDKESQRAYFVETKTGAVQWGFPGDPGQSEKERESESESEKHYMHHVTYQECNTNTTSWTKKDSWGDDATNTSSKWPYAKRAQNKDLNLTSRWPRRTERVFFVGGKLMGTVRLRD